MVKIRENEYEVITDYGEGLSSVDLEEIATEYFDNFDYIVGDFAYGKVRLKGFYESDNKQKKEHNDIKNVDDYIKNSCAYGCKYFILKKINDKVIEK